jgi:hypothetical protein
MRASLPETKDNDMILKQQHMLRTMLLAIPLCLIVSAVGMTQDKTEGDESAERRNAPQPKSEGAAGLNNSYGGFGGGEYEAGGFGGFGGTKTERLIVGNNIMISWSKDNDELRGFSQKTGEWTNLKIEKQEKLVPVVSTDVAAVRVGDTMAAYSGSTGTWDVLRLSENSKAEPTVYTTHVQTTDNDYLYTFAAAKGKWTSPNDPEFQSSTGEFRTGVGVVSPVRPGSVPGGSMFGGMSEYSKYPNRYRLPTPSLDAQAIQLARKFRGKGLDNNEARKALTESVAKAFDQRQKHQKAEADRLAEKLKKIQEAIEKRESLREKIIRRRVDELLDPNVEWDKAFPRGGSSSYGPPGSSLSYPSPPLNQEKTPVIQKLTAEQVEIAIDHVDGAPADRIEKRDCLVITGLIRDAAARRLNNFELQFQEFTAIPSAFAFNDAQWKRFDLKSSIDMIQSSQGIQADQLPTELTNPVVTEPLPMLKAGNWSAAVVHPDLRKSLENPPDDTIQFRVLDFDVKPSHYYRYRVRLATAVEGQQIWGDWSKPTHLRKVEAADVKE